MSIVATAHKPKEALIALGVLPPLIPDREIDYTPLGLVVPEKDPGGGE